MWLTSYLFAQAIHVALRPTKVVAWGGVPDVVNRDKFRQNWLRGFGFLRGQILPFDYA